MTDTAAIPEPADGRRVVVEFADGPPHLYWRDNAQADQWPTEPGEHWFNALTSDRGNLAPVTWVGVQSDAKAVHLVPNQPLTAADPTGAIRDIVAAAIRVADGGIERGSRALADAICDALTGTGVGWDRRTVAEAIGEVDGWDEIGSEELAHHVLAGMFERLQRVSA